MSLHKVARTMEIRPSTLSTWLNKFEDGVPLSLHHCPTARALSNEHKEALLAHCELHPQATLDDYKEHLKSEFDGFVVSQATIDCFFKDEAQVTLKRIKPTTPLSDARDPVRIGQRAAWVEHVRKLPPPIEWIYVNESGFNLHQTR